MKHGRDCPRLCSQCRQASGEAVVVKRVDQQRGEILVDGVSAGRAIDIESEVARRRFAKNTARRTP